MKKLKTKTINKYTSSKNSSLTRVINTIINGFTEEYKTPNKLPTKPDIDKLILQNSIKATHPTKHTDKKLILTERLMNFIQLKHFSKLINWNNTESLEKLEHTVQIKKAFTKDRQIIYNLDHPERIE